MLLLEVTQWLKLDMKYMDLIVCATIIISLLMVPIIGDAMNHVQ